ncbi:DUF2634 domain-containing protein [Solibacillus sp. FSL H8-0523]|uniref:DUF2634 domain-containing protein n=1 Tax=Solibacillus sp. FSL H8-0523 TaxID=2954511 RepID=UPI003100FD9D
MKTIDLINGDLHFENGDFVLIDGPEEVAQCVEISIGTNLGGWFLDESAGTEHMLLLEKTTDDEARSEVLRVLAQEERIDMIESVTVISDKKARKRTINYVVTLASGVVLERDVILNA